MSGPKVVRVVTREELLARALDQIATFERAIERYAALGRRHDVDLSTEIAMHRKGVAELKMIAQASAWDAIARSSAKNTLAIEHDCHALEDKLIAAATKDRTVRRRLKEAAKAIHREALALNLTLPGDLNDVIDNAESATADQIKRMDAAVASASRALVEHSRQSKAADNSLAARLASGLSQENYADWLANNVVGAEGQKSVRLDKILAELNFRDFAPTERVAAAIQRIRGASDDERDLLIDSLIIELIDVLKTHRQRSEETLRLGEWMARLEREGSREALDLHNAMRAWISSGHIDNLSDWERRAQDVLKASRAKDNAIHQRKALLSGLTALGYEVREGMATALVENGRLVVKKPAEVEYGVEILSGASDGKLQVRMVTFQSEPNPIRDKDTEVIWCGEFSQLQASLARAGHALHIEKAHAPGTVPIKLEQMPTEQDVYAGAEVKKPQTRSI